MIVMTGKELVDYIKSHGLEDCLFVEFIGDGEHDSYRSAGFGDYGVFRKGGYACLPKGFSMEYDGSIYNEDNIILVV